MMLKKVIERAELSPKMLFVIDGLGAMLSAFLLGIVLARLEHIFGIPVSMLYVLASLPIFFAVYDFYSYYRGNQGQFLKGIGTMNLLYCVLSMGFAFYHSGTLTFLGWLYILLEILIVITLALVELRIANRLSRKKAIHQ